MIVNVYISYDINLTENSRECAMALKEYTVDYCISYYGHMFEYLTIITVRRNFRCSFLDFV